MKAKTEVVVNTTTAIAKIATVTVFQVLIQFTSTNTIAYEWYRSWLKQK
jgi:hypothetical protein